MNLKLPVNYDEIDFKERKEVKEQYIKVQKEKCWYCGRNLFKDPPEEMKKLYIIKTLFPKNFFMYPIHLHHDHNTGMTIGAVHSLCNAVLWQYEGK
jgi:hypothetical protein